MLLAHHTKENALPFPVAKRFESEMRNLLTEPRINICGTVVFTDNYDDADVRRAVKITDSSTKVKHIIMIKYHPINEWTDRTKLLRIITPRHLIIINKHYVTKYLIQTKFRLDCTHVKWRSRDFQHGYNTQKPVINSTITDHSCLAATILCERRAKHRCPFSGRPANSWQRNLERIIIKIEL